MRQLPFWEANSSQRIYFNLSVGLILLFRNFLLISRVHSRSLKINDDGLYTAMLIKEKPAGLRLTMNKKFAAVQPLDTVLIIGRFLAVLIATPEFQMSQSKSVLRISFFSIFFSRSSFPRTLRCTNKWTNAWTRRREIVVDRIEWIHRRNYNVTTNHRCLSKHVINWRFFLDASQLLKEIWM